MKMMKFVTCAVCAALCGAAFAAEPYDKRLEFVESTGTQWIDTGLKLHYRNSRAQVNFRLLEMPAATVTICGETPAKGDACGYLSETGYDPRGSFVVKIQRSSATTYRIVPSFSGGEGGGYEWPTGATADFKRVWEVFNIWSLHSAKDQHYGTNVYSCINGQYTGGYYRNYKNRFSEYNYYIGVANNAGEGLFNAEGTLAKLHWYGAKFWTNDELVGDFIPVLKDGVAGFYDNVSRKFFPSQGADAWVAPVEREWIGGGVANDLTDAENWKDGNVPSAMSDVAVFPAGTAIETTVNGGCEFFTNVGGIRLVGEDTSLCLNGITSSTSFMPAVGGKGRIHFGGDKSQKIGLKLYGSMQTFEGVAEITNIYTHAMSTYCLGDRDLSEAFVWLDGSEQRYAWGTDQYCGVSRAKIHFRKSGQFLFYSGTLHDYGEAIFDYADASMHGNTSSAGNYHGRLVGNDVAANTLYPYSASKFSMDGEEKYLNLSVLSLDTQGSIACRVHSKPRLHGSLTWSGSKIDGSLGCGQNMANIRLYAGRSLAFGFPDALDEDAFLQVGYAQGVAAQKSNVIDLGGFDQRLGTLSVWATEFDAGTLWNTNLVLTSASPAKLTICGQLRDDGCAHVFPGRVRGAAGVKLDSKDEVMADAWNWRAGDPGAIKFNCPGSDTTGCLEVNRGTMEILPTATFSNLSSVVVSGEGVMKVGTCAVGNAAPGFTVAIKDSTATLELADGLSNVCYTCEIPGGEFLRAGVYSGTAQEGATYCEYLSGAGKLEVKVYGKPWSGWPEAGTVDSVYIVQNSKVTITDDDVEKVQALSLVECGDGVTIDCRLTEKSIDFLPKFVGDVKIRYWGKGVDDTVVISGDNSGLVAPGGWFLSNCTAKVCHRYGLGSAATAAAEVYSIKDKAYSVLCFDGADVLENDVALKFVNASWLYHTDPDVEFLQNAPVTASGLDTSGSRRFKLKHRLTLTTGTSSLNTTTMSSPANEPCVLTVAEGATLKCNGNFGTGSFVINGSYVGDLRIEQCMTKIVIGRDNPISSGFAMMYDSSQAGFQFDLNGHDLSLTEIHGNQYPYTSDWSRQQVIPFYSELPAVFSITGRLTSTRACAARFTGAAGVRIASGAAQTNVFGKGESRTTGSLAMDSGKLKLERGFTWRGAAVELNGGELTVDVTTAPEVFGPASGKDRSKTVLVANGGTLTLNSSAAADETPVCCVQTGANEYLAPGAYVAGSDSAPAWLKGTGTLRVLRAYPPGGGLMMIVR